MRRGSVKRKERRYIGGFNKRWFVIIWKALETLVRLRDWALKRGVFCLPVATEGVEM